MNIPSSTIVKTGLLVGTLDILSAFTYYYIRTGNGEVWNVLKYVASGALGKEATTGGAGAAITGLCFHYLIAFSFTLFFFSLYPRLSLFLKSRLLTGVLYGLFVWCVMNLLVVPASRIGSRPFNVTNALINALILIVCIGLPLSFLASRFYREKSAVPAAA